MDTQAIIKQSKNALGQWHKVWSENAEHHRKFAPFKPINDFMGVGIGRAILLVANGASFEENLETIKKYKDNVDILCCDKTLGHLLDNGIEPTYCMVCDANVNYEKYMEPYKDKLKNTILFMNICGNTKWTDNGNWKDIYFFVNKDVLQSEAEFSKISGCHNHIPAATNVSNAMVVLLTQCSNVQRINYFGYDRLILIGFDYCWGVGSNYYSFDNDGNGKYYYMKHNYILNRAGEYCFSSTNLTFSAQWLTDYCKIFALPVVLGSNKSMLGHMKYIPLEKAIQYKYRPEDRTKVMYTAGKIKELSKELHKLESELKLISRDHCIAQLAHC